MSKQPLSFQQVIMKLHEFWAAQGCVIWEPYNVQVGAGTGNPATLLRVLGPEPWRVAYVEPSVRPDDGRFGENPNRMQKYYQYQVILKPDPGNPQELYLKSLEALGIDPREHDIRFVEDNWESPALGAWGLGWEVWLDGQEITQFTYFQQAGGLELNPVSVEITYGVERIVLALQGKDSAWAIDWMAGLQYRDMFLEEEIQHCRYYFDIADVDALKKVYDTYEREYQRALEGDALIAAYDYVLKCSHLFNVLDTRGAIGVTERASYFRRMRDMTRNSARAYLQQRERLEFPLMKMASRWSSPLPALPERHMPQQPAAAADVVFELGIEELPADDVDTALAQLRAGVTALFEQHQLSHEGLEVHATPRRLMFYARKVSPFQPDSETIEKGPPANRAFDAEGKPTKAAEGFAKSRGIALDALTVAEVDGGQYVMAKVFRKGRAAIEVLAEALPALIAEIKFGKSMRWNATNAAFSRPVRWIVAMYDDVVIPFSYAGVSTDNITRGLRPYGSPEITLLDADSYLTAMQTQGIVLDSDKRRAHIVEQVNALAAEVNGHVPMDAGLVAEVVNLVESPTAIRGTFDAEYLTLPRDVLVTVMRKHQRYFPVEDADGKLMPYFITIRNGDSQHVDIVAKGNEHVLQARFYDANFFYKQDRQKPLSEHLQRLATLTFEEHLGSMLDKNQRVAGMVDSVGKMLGFKEADIETAAKAAKLAKADLGSNMVVEMTSLQGTMGREYALLEGIEAPIANAIFEHWQPRNADDSLPASAPGALLAIVDRLDSLTGLFGAGLAPKSTADPYGLRRAALGLLQILIAREIDASLSKLIETAATAMPIEVKPELRDTLQEFIAGRLRVWLGDQGYAPDVISAVLAEQAHNPYRAVEGVRQLSTWVTRENWERILDSFARCVRITRGENQRFAVDPKMFQQQEERNLYEAYLKAAAAIGEDGDINAFLSAFEQIVPVVSKFFGENPGEGVLVNTEDARVRANRIALLQQISALQKGRADLGQLVGF